MTLAWLSNPISPLAVSIPCVLGRAFLDYKVGIFGDATCMTDVWRTQKARHDPPV